MPTWIAPDIIDTKRPASRDRFGGAVRQAHHMREIERLTATNHHHHRANSFNKAWQPHLPSSHSDDGVRTNLLFTMSNRTSGSSEERTTNLGSNDFLTLTTSSRQPTKEGWWSRTGSNRRHPACKAGALPAELRPLIPG